MEAKRDMVEARRRGAAATKDHGGVVRPSQLIASVRLTCPEFGRRLKWTTACHSSLR